jgi:hypothetical protein
LILEDFVSLHGRKVNGNVHACLTWEWFNVSYDLTGDSVSVRG